MSYFARWRKITTQYSSLGQNLSLAYALLFQVPNLNLNNVQKTNPPLIGFIKVRDLKSNVWAWSKSARKDFVCMRLMQKDLELHGQHPLKTHHRINPSLVFSQLPQLCHEMFLDDPHHVVCQR
jgi:hypothetical protein